MYWSEKWRCLAIEEKNQVINRKHGRGAQARRKIGCELPWRCLKDHVDEHREELVCAVRPTTRMTNRRVDALLSWKNREMKSRVR
jgi:hypothetical protein